MFAGNERRTNSRAYVRDVDFYTEALVSKDEKYWRDITVTDLSAGGLKFFVEDSEYKVGDTLWFRVSVRTFAGLADHNVYAKGVVKRDFHAQDGDEYGVAFKDLSPEMSIRIDEIILQKNRFAHVDDEYDKEE
jgi:hypothetical protein